MTTTMPSKDTVSEIIYRIPLDIITAGRVLTVSLDLLTSKLFEEYA